MHRFVFTALCILGVALFAVSCADNGSTTGPSDEQIPGLMAGSSPDMALADPAIEAVTFEDVVALAGAGKANSSDCRTLSGWYRNSNASPPYWYAHGLLWSDECVKAVTGYKWKVKIGIRNMAGGDKDYTVTGPGGSMNVSVDAGDTWFYGWTKCNKGTFKVESDDTGRYSLVIIYLTETWRNTD